MTQKVESPEKLFSQTFSWDAIVALSGGVLALSLAPIFIRFSAQELGATAIIFNRLWIATIALGLWKIIDVLLKKKSPDLSIQQQSYTLGDVAILLVSAIFNAACLVCWAWSLTQTSVANANILHNLTPIFATLGGWLFLGHFFDRRFVIGMLVAVGGAICIGIEDLQIATDTFLADSIALLSAVFYAATFMLAERLRVKFSTTTILLWCSFLSSLLLLPVVLIVEDRVFPISLSGWLAVSFLGIVCTGMGIGAVLYSLKRVSSGFASLFLLLEPPIAAMLAWVIFAESLNLLNGLAFVIALLGIYLSQSGQGANKVMDVGE
jgi:drug/metabolite transporter (DMT)-like permease